MKLACFCILHYKVYNETIKCVKSLLKLKGIDKCIILVYDNFSNDGSADIIEEKFALYDNVKVCINNEASGFSGGNNKAYKIAKRFNPRFMIMLNNDIVIKQKDFLLKLNEIYNSETYHFIGPDIFAPTVAKHQSPLYKDIPDIKQLESETEGIRKKLNNVDSYSGREKRSLFKNKIKKFIPYPIIFVIRKITGNTEAENKFYKSIHYNPVFSGSCIIVTDKYIKDNDVLFFPETKFYYEELLLALRCKRENYKTIYNPILKVWHYHGISTMKSSADIKDYMTFKCNNMIDSFKIYKEEYEKKIDI